MSPRSVALLLVLSFLVPACGDGGSEDSPPAPETTRLALVGDLETGGLAELYVTDLLGSGRLKRSGPMAGGAAGVLQGVLTDLPTLRNLFWSPDGRYLGYVADQDTPGVRELYVVPSEGGVPVKVSPPGMVAGGNVRKATWSSDSSWIGFVADAGVDAVDELFVVHPDGSGRQKVSGTMPAGSPGVIDFRWSPTSARIAYQAREDSSTLHELYTVFANGTGLLKVSQVLPGTGMAGVESEFSWSPDGTRIAYRAVQNTAGVTELYTVKPDGTLNVRVNTPLIAGQGVGTNFLFWYSNWSPDSTKLAHIVGGGSTELHVGRADGSGSVKVSGTLVAGGNVGFLHYPWAPNGSRVSYGADQDTNDVWEIYSVVPDGTGRLKVSAPIVPGGTIGTGDPAVGWFQDSLRAYYVGEASTLGLKELFTCRPDLAGSGVKVSGTILGGGVEDVWPSRDNQLVGFIAQGDTVGLKEAYVVPRDGGTRTKISPVLSPGGRVVGITANPGTSRYVLRVQLDAGAKTEVFSVLPDGSDLIKVSGPTPVGAGATGAYFSP